MSVRRWPDTLPGPSTADYGLSPIDPSVRTAMEVGAQRTRRRTLARMDRVKLQWRLSPQEYAVFRSWYEALAVSLTGASDDLVAWTLFNATRSAGVAISPEDILVDRVLETTATGTHRASINVTGANIDSVTLISRATIKAAGRSKARLALIDRASVSNSVDINLTTGVLSGASGLIAQTVSNRGNGWWRVTITASTGIGAAVPIMRINAADDAGAVNYTGDIAKGLDICEVQGRLLSGYDLFTPSDVNGKALGADGGSAWFYTLVPTEGGLIMAEARFAGPFSEAIEPGLIRIVSAELEVRHA